MASATIKESSSEKTENEDKEAMEQQKQRADLFLQEIEAVDDYWGPTFRAIYENQEQQYFMKRLEDRIVEHDSNIEKMCNYHYQHNHLCWCR